MNQSEIPTPAGKCLGKMPHRGDPRTLLLAQFLSLDKIPAAFYLWKRRAPFMPRTFGNTQEGCCTKASQALAAMRFERLETSATISIADAEIHRVYREGCQRHYGTTDDVGMYETDALGDFRNQDTTFRDAKGHAITIDAYTAINPLNADEVRAGIATSGRWGIKLCLSLPLAYSRIEPPEKWDVPADGKFTGDWVPGSWGGHSLFADSYDKTGVRLVHSWYEGEGVDKAQWPFDKQWITWAGLAAYCDESYWLLQSIDAWRQKPKAEQGAVDVAGIRKAVNKVSPCKIK